MCYKLTWLVCLQVCVYALLVLKTAQQAFLDSLPLFTVCTADTCVHACMLRLGRDRAEVVQSWLAVRVHWCCCGIIFACHVCCCRRLHSAGRTAPMGFMWAACAWQCFQVGRQQTSSSITHDMPGNHPSTRVVFRAASALKLSEDMSAPYCDCDRVCSDIHDRRNIVAHLRPHPDGILADADAAGLRAAVLRRIPQVRGMRITRVT